MMKAIDKTIQTIARLAVLWVLVSVVGTCGYIGYMAVFGVPEGLETAAAAARTEEPKVAAKPKPACSGDPVTAYVMIQPAVKARLRAPSRAEFPWFSRVKVTEEAGCVYGVAGYVDAANGFGAMVRTAFVGSIRGYDDGTWQVQKVTLLD